MYKGLNSIKNMQCNKIEGAMYAFPEIKLSKSAEAAAAERGIPADTLYVMECLEETGIILVPGSGFGQQEGTYHFRITILPSLEKMEEVLQRLTEFNEGFHNRYP